MQWTPADDSYDERRALFAEMIDSRPRPFAMCGSPDEVKAAALARAAAASPAVAVRSGAYGGRPAGATRSRNQDIRPAG